MKISSLFLFLSLFIVLSFANDICQYADYVNVTQEVPVIVFNNQKFYGDAIILDNFRHVSVSQYLTWTCNYQDSFDVINQLPIPLNVDVSYFFKGEIIKKSIRLDPKGTETIIEEYRMKYTGADCIKNTKLAPSQIDINTIKIMVPEGQFEILYETEIVEKRICRECPPSSGSLCINDGEYSDMDIKCGSGKRNSKGICMSIEEQNAIIPSDFMGNLSDVVIQVIIVLILIIFIIIALKNSSKPPPDKVIHVWER